MFATNKRLSVKGSKVVTASMSQLNAGGASMGGYGNLNISAISTYFQRSETLLRGIADEQEIAFRTFYRDIYRYDVVAGTAIDMMSVLPFSDFTLQGVSDKQQEVYWKSINNLGLTSLFPELSVDYYVSGRSVSSLLYDEDKEIFTDLISYNPDTVDIQPSILYNTEPLVKVRVDAEMRNFMQSRDPYLSRLRGRMPPSVRTALSHSHVVLDPLTTLFVPRKLTPRSTGTSLLRRLIPIYLLEKVLYRGTINEATRRQRAIGHITAGSQFWEPQDADLNSILQMFQQADLDPSGAMIATRNDVQYQDIRPSGDFWKWTDTTDQLTPLKMRALGINDALLSGDANIATMESSLSLFLENLRSFRASVTQAVFYKRVFPLISAVHGFKDAKSAPKIETGMARMDNLDDETENEILMGGGGWLIPQVHWHKALRPEADREYLDVLNTMAERGVPVGLRLWAAAGGIDIDKQVEELEADRKLREKIQKLTGYQQPAGEQDDSYEGSDDQQEVSRLVDSMSPEEAHKAMREAAGLHVPRPLLAREFGANAEIVGRTRTGRAKLVHNQSAANRKMDEIASLALKRLSDPQHYAQVVANNKPDKNETNT